ncbi:putative tRNA (uracil-O(2)-)-methyltransferase isoform X1 [Petromyzon marinus]|uniref:putative tRNA (uracil-O(2)-)-methyltransferase isoform X1 n=2 Tax=Petromyzon marinus TaxID=7757 RepID=UPI003F6FBBA8
MQFRPSKAAAGEELAMEDKFWEAVEVWVRKPQVLNRRLCGASVAAREIARGLGALRDLLERGQSSQLSSDEADKVLRLWLKGNFCGERRERAAAAATDSEGGGPECDGLQFEVITRTLIPKELHKFAKMQELIVRDIRNALFVSVPLMEDAAGVVSVRTSNIYTVTCGTDDTKQWHVEVQACGDGEWQVDGVTLPALVWLETHFVPKLHKWMGENKQSDFPDSLSLLPVEKYGLLYQRLKEKYRNLVKVWPEVTDPEKFVYEDVAIASYLLVLWEEERAERGLEGRQSFVDLGCGNGLLVHILASEGHPGRGIDVRKRKIWDWYGAETILEECAITPGDDFLFTDVDWLIGNHSDELTPWIPVIAARSSFDCRYFVLPCCFHDFIGRYRRRSCRRSQYREYLDFVAEIGNACGFRVQEDTLRIPSTKRVCQVGKTRMYPQSEEALLEERRADFIRRRVGGQACRPPQPCSGHVNHRQQPRPSPAPPPGFLSAQEPDIKIPGKVMSDSPGRRKTASQDVLHHQASEHGDGISVGVQSLADFASEVDTKTADFPHCTLQQQSSNENINGTSFCGSNVHTDARFCNVGKSSNDVFMNDTLDSAHCTTLDLEAEQKGEIVGEFHRNLLIKEPDAEHNEQPASSDTRPAGGWLGEFRPREREERVRNCVRLPLGLVERVVETVAKALLASTEERVNDGGTQESSPHWNRGGSIPLEGAAKLIDGETLQQLKCECGGLKTLLKNSHQVFIVLQSRVQLRDWRREQVVKKPKNNRKKSAADCYKTRVCWFYSHHPDGCPREASCCPYAHGLEDLHGEQGQGRSCPQTTWF